MKFRDLFPGHGSVHCGKRLKLAFGVSHLDYTAFALSCRQLFELFNGLFNRDGRAPRAIGGGAAIQNSSSALRPEWERRASSLRHNENGQGNFILAGNWIAASALSDQPSSKVTASLSLPPVCHSSSFARLANSQVSDAYFRKPANVLLRTIIPPSEAVCCSSESVKTRWNVRTMVPCLCTHLRARYNMPDARSRPAQNALPWALSSDLVNGLAMFRPCLQIARNPRRRNSRASSRRGKVK